MADITQATKWLIEGKRVRRGSWPTGDFAVRCEPASTQMAYCVWRGVPNAPISQTWDARLDSLIAQDWELLPEQYQDLEGNNG